MLTFVHCDLVHIHENTDYSFTFVYCLRVTNFFAILSHVCIRNKNSLLIVMFSNRFVSLDSIFFYLLQKALWIAFFQLKKYLTTSLMSGTFKKFQKLETFLKNKLLSCSSQFQLLLPIKDLKWLNPKSQIHSFIHSCLLQETHM